MKRIYNLLISLWTFQGIVTLAIAMCVMGSLMLPSNLAFFSGIDDTLTSVNGRRKFPPHHLAQRFEPQSTAKQHRPRHARRKCFISLARRRRGSHQLCDPHEVEAEAEKHRTGCRVNPPAPPQGVQALSQSPGRRSQSKHRDSSSEPIQD